MWKLWCLALGEKASKKNHEAAKGRIFSEEHKRKLSESKKGKTYTKGTKEIT
jgi:hypothetical protein